MVSEWIVGRLAGAYGVDSVGSGYGPVAGFCDYVDEPSSSGATDLVNIIIFKQSIYCIDISTLKPTVYAKSECSVAFKLLYLN
jgi:hypothetical protein